MSNIVEQNMSTLSIKRADVVALGKYIKATDTDSEYGLTNYCYNADLPSDDDEFDKNWGLISRVRGIVYAGDELVMSAFPYTEQYTADTVGGNMWWEANGGFQKSRFFECHEGALIRMFYFKDKWFLTTHRKMNAFKSIWGSSESYGTSFKNALKAEVDTNDNLRESLMLGDGNFYDDFKRILNKTRQYTFLVLNNDSNRIVCDAPSRPTLIHVGTFVDGKLDLDDDIKVTKPTELFFDDIRQLHNHVKGVDPMVSPGVISFAPNNRQVKICSDEYVNLASLRGNQSSLKFRYLQIRNDHEKNMALRKLYPNDVADFDLYEGYLNRASKSIHDAYIRRFIKKEHVRVSQAEFAVVRTAHSWFMEGYNTGNRNIVTVDVIKQIVDEQNPTTLNQIVKKIKHDAIVAEKTKMDDLTQSVKDLKVDEVVDKTVDTYKKRYNGYNGGKHWDRSYLDRIGGERDTKMQKVEVEDVGKNFDRYLVSHKPKDEWLDNPGDRISD
jgi:hypothetical protein